MGIHIKVNFKKKEWFSIPYLNIICDKCQFFSNILILVTNWDKHNHQSHWLLSTKIAIANCNYDPFKKNILATFKKYYKQIFFSAEI